MPSATVPLDDKAWMLSTLRALADVGVRMAQALEEELNTAGRATAEQAMRFARVSRAVQKSVALYGLILEDKLATLAKAPAEHAAPKPRLKPNQTGERVRDMALFLAKGQVGNLAQPEVLRGLRLEIDEWRADAAFDGLYDGRPHEEVMAEIFLMLGLTVPPDNRYHALTARLAEEAERGEPQPWRAAWGFLAARPRPVFRRPTVEEARTDRWYIFGDREFELDEGPAIEDSA